MDRKKLVRETLETTRDYSGKTAQFIREIAAKIQGGGRVELSGWEDLIKGLEWLAEVCSALAGEPSLGLATAAKLRGFVAELPPILQELSQAMEKRDVVSLGDFLEYELAEKIAELHETLLSCAWRESGGLADTGAN